jgi:hypothetical protein
MKTANALEQQFSFTESQTDAQLEDDFDDLARRATHGDGRALGAIAIAMSPMFLEEARDALGEHFAREAGDVLQDFFLMLLEGRLRFMPAYGRAIEWMCGIIREMARMRRVECEVRWGIEDDP